MMSAVFFAKILLLLVLFLVNSRGVQQGLLCNWVCGDTIKVAVGTHELTAAKFNFSKRVDSHCQDDRAVNSSDFIKVGIILARNVDNLSEFNFLIFGMEVLSEHVSSLLFGNQYEELESFNNSVSCVLQPKSNVSRTVASNGLDTLYSPLFYLRGSVGNSQKTPYVGYVEIGGTYYLSAGFSNSATPEYRLKFVQRELTLVINLSILLVVVFTLFIPSVLSLFPPTIKTVQIERLSRPTNVDEPEDNPCLEETRSPISTRRLSPIEQWDPPRVNLNSDHNILSAAANQGARKEFLSSRVTAGHGELKGTLADFSSLPIEDLDQVSSSLRAVRYARGFGTRLSNQENNSSNEHSEMVGLRRPAVKVNPPPTVSEFSQTHSGGTSGHGASGSISTMEQSSVIATIEPDTPQTGVQHQNIQNRNLDSVTVMDVGAPASPVGLRSFIANNVFSKSQSLSLAYQIIMFVMLITFPHFFAYCMDAFVLGIPRLFPRIAFNLPSPFLTKSGFIFTHEVCPGFMYFCFFCYFIRICCFCFLQSSSNWVPIWVPSFLDRKHFICFLKIHYLSQLVFPNNSWSACDECKKAPEVEIPVNIKNNLVYIFSLHIFHKNVRDLYPMYQQWWLLQGNEAASIFRSLGKWLVLFLWVLGLFILFTVLLALDIIASLPVISLCYGRVWFVLDWSKSRLENCCFQAFCLIGEFCVIFFSIVWIVYFSFCCSLSVVLALLPFYIAGINYPGEIVLSVACYIIVGHIFWRCYSLFTDKYENLLQKLINTCSEDHASELNRYKKGDVINIPWKLFTSACDKLRPIKSSLQELCVHLIVWVFFLFLAFSFSMGSNNGTPTSIVLLGTNSFIVVVQFKIWDFLLGSSEEKERKDEEFKIKVKDHVDAFFKGKLD